LSTVHLTIATRESRLALWQAHHLQDLLQELGCKVDILGMTTQGDQILDRSLSKVGGKGLFVKELEVALEEGRADLAAIDCVTWALFQKYTTPVTQGLQSIGMSAPYPGLPLVCALGTDAPTLAAIQSALHALVHQCAARPALDALLIRDFESPPLSVYQRCMDMEQEALALGYPVLA
jgi:hypothetical protein